MYPNDVPFMIALAISGFYLIIYQLEEDLLFPCSMEIQVTPCPRLAEPQQKQKSTQEGQKPEIRSSKAQISKSLLPSQQRQFERYHRRRRIQRQMQARALKSEGKEPIGNEITTMIA